MSIDAITLRTFTSGDVPETVGWIPSGSGRSCESGEDFTIADNSPIQISFVHDDTCEKYSLTCNETELCEIMKTLPSGGYSVKTTTKHGDGLEEHTALWVFDSVAECRQYAGKLPHVFKWMNQSLGDTEEDLVEGEKVFATQRFWTVYGPKNAADDLYWQMTKGCWQ